MYLSVNNKSDFRKEILFNRVNYQGGGNELALSYSIGQQILNFLAANYNFPISIGIYFPLRGEVNILNIFKDFYHTLKNKFNFLLPVILGEEMIFGKYEFNDMLIKNKKINIMEPQNKTEQFLDLIILPGLAFSCEGYRLGFGKGHYDKYCAKMIRIGKVFTTVGVTFHQNLFLTLPFNEHDHKLNYIITDKIFIKIYA